MPQASPAGNYNLRVYTRYMTTHDRDTSLQELKDLVVQFREERGWGKHHTPKNLAISIALEAAELLEHFQWDEYRQDDKESMAEELIDVLINCFNFADILDIDIAPVFKAKLEKAKQKYPVELFNPKRDGNDDYFRIKQAYRQKGQP